MRLDPSLLPRVHPSHAGNGLDFATLETEYSTLEMYPWRIVAVLGTPVVSAEPNGNLHFDALLGAAILNSHPCSPQWQEEACIVPLPLELIWQSPQGLPLWACTDFSPAITAYFSKEYIHKRYPEQHAKLSKKLDADRSRGRWKEYRIPYGTVVAQVYEAFVLGHAATLERLLKHDSMTHVGKYQRNGHGRVLEWRLEPWDVSHSQAVQHILKHRPVPVEYLEQNNFEYWGATHRSWTAPHWYKPWHSSVVAP